MEISPLHPSRLRVREDIPLEKLAHSAGLSEDQKVAEAARQFEAALLRQILTESRKPVFHSTLTEKSAVTGIYDDLVTSQLADSISRSGEFGLARSLTSQLHHPTEPRPALQPTSAGDSAGPVRPTDS
jgi:Rod binding domain-containing protein